MSMHKLYTKVGRLCIWWFTSGYDRLIGADGNSRDRQDLTPLDWAKTHGAVESFRTLRAAVIDTLTLDKLMVSKPKSIGSDA
jgi:ankyrin repeat protein